MLVQKKDNKEYYAMKSIHKSIIIEKDQLEHLKSEREVLKTVDFPFLVRLSFAFQTKEKIFLVTDFMKGGELFQHLRANKRFSEERSKFYVAEIILALEYLHSKNIVFRDLKPENILLDHLGHICLTDFGMTKFIG